MDAPLPFVLRRPVVAGLIAWLAIDGLAGLVLSVIPIDLEFPGDSGRLSAAGLAAVVVIALRIRAARALRATGAAAPRAATPAVLVAVAIVLLFLSAGWIHVATLPAAARPEAIEARFGPAIERLHELARDRAVFRANLEPAADPAFSDPALIQASVWRRQGSQGRTLRVVHDDGRRSPGGHTWFPRHAGEPGEQATNLWTRDSSRIVEYERAASRVGGRVQGFTIHVDLDALDRP